MKDPNPNRNATPGTSSKGFQPASGQAVERYEAPQHPPLPGRASHADQRHEDQRRLRRRRGSQIHPASLRKGEVAVAVDDGTWMDLLAALRTATRCCCRPTVVRSTRSTGRLGAARGTKLPTTPQQMSADAARGCVAWHQERHQSDAERTRPRTSRRQASMPGTVTRDTHRPDRHGRAA